MDSLIYSLITSATTGLTFIAYKHPNVYARIHPYLNALLFAAICATGAWNLALAKINGKISGLVPADKLPMFQEAIDSLSIPFIFQMVVPLAISIYLVFLMILPILIHENESTEKHQLSRRSTGRGKRRRAS